MEKYGFVYIWFDRKRKMFYIGCHWGHEEDGYVCSSNRMRNVYKRRPEDFKRRILKRVDNRPDLYDEEHKWLNLIEDCDLSTRYYNVRKHKWNHWSSDQSKYNKIFTDKYRENHSNMMKGENNHFYGKKHTIESREKIKKAREKQVFTDEHKASISESHKGENNHFYGKTHSEETKRMIKEKVKKLWEDPEYRKLQLERRKKL